jgi:hypothetical protein
MRQNRTTGLTARSVLRRGGGTQRVGGEVSELRPTEVTLEEPGTP